MNCSAVENITCTETISIESREEVGKTHFFEGSRNGWINHLCSRYDQKGKDCEIEQVINKKYF